MNELPNYILDIYIRKIEFSSSNEVNNNVGCLRDLNIFLNI